MSSYVNLELETDSLVEATRSALAPLGMFSNDVTKKINRTLPQFNFESLGPDDVRIDV